MPQPNPTTRCIVIPFPIRSRPAEMGATRWQVLVGRLRTFLGRLVNYAGVPGFVRAMDFHDELTGQSIVIAPGLLFTRISVNGRDYYFRRFSGRFDGTGLSTGCPR